MSGKTSIERLAKIADWQRRNPEKVKSYKAKYAEAHKKEKAEHSKIYRAKNKDKTRLYYLAHQKEQCAYSRSYHRANVKNLHAGYGGAVTCSKCGKHGYKRYMIQRNELTGHEWRYTVVQHQHSENRKTIHDGSCLIGNGFL